ncbi:hypothetical protein MAP00_001476 [Monascus purpureus]|nr:hypothetical protein MAP00_001476 [Monascus purpureus]
MSDMSNRMLAIGMRHARHFATLTPRAHLVAVCSPVQAELDAAKNEFGGHLRTYLDYDRMLQHEPTLQAVVVASVASAHAEQAVKAIERGLHVLCEKPLSTSLEEAECVLAAYKKSLLTRPGQKVMCGFSRRFDASYRDAHARVARGDIGVPSVFRSQTCDKLDLSTFTPAYSGIFTESSVHDIDLTLWFLGEDSRVKSVFAAGITAIEPALRERNDRDNGIGIVEFYNGKIAQLLVSRMMAAGQEDTTEIIGTQGKIAVNAAPQLNLVHIHDATGIRREVPADYFGRFREAFITEANEFTASCLNDTPAPIRLDSTVNAMKIACALQESMVTGQKVEFDESGQRVSLAKL